MRRYLAYLPAIGVGLVLAFAGLFIGRALRGGDDPVAEPGPFAVLDGGRQLSFADIEAAVADSGGGDAADGVSVAELLPRPERLVPVLEPVHVGFDAEAGLQLLATDARPEGAPGSELDDGAGVPAIGGAAPAYGPAPLGEVEVVPGTAPAGADLPSGGTADTTGDTTGGAPTGDAPAGDPGGAPAGGTPYVYDDFSGRWYALGVDLVPAIDPCAGVFAGLPVPGGCPGGFAATMGEVRTPPVPFAFFGAAHYLEATVPDGPTCPAATVPPGAGQVGVTIFSRTPLESAVVRYRPYGSSRAWSEVTVEPASPPGQISRWNETFAEREWEIDWGTVPVCVTLDRPTDGAYELSGSAVDTFGRAVTINPGLIGAVDPSLRPPTTGRIVANGSYGLVDTRTVEGGRVEFRSRVVVDPTDLAELDCPATSSPPLGPDAVHSASGYPAHPVGVYDPDFDWLFSARVPIPQAGQVLVCATVFLTDNPIDPLVTDRVLLTAPDQIKPRIVLQGIRRLGDSTIAAEALTVFGQSIVAESRSYDPCTSRWRNLDDIAPGRPLTVEQVLWECTSAPLPLDDTGRVEVEVTLVRRAGPSGDRIEQAVIPIELADCRVAGCERPREWYEIPIPWGGSRLCGTGFGSGGCSDPVPPDGIAVIRVDYPLVDGLFEGPGSVVLIDQIDPVLTGDEPRFTRPEFDVGPASMTDPADLFVQGGTMRFFSDRPVRVAVDITQQFFGEDECFEGSDIPMSDEFATDFEIAIDGLCAGASYRFDLVAIDEAGTRYDIEHFADYTVRAVWRMWDVEVRFLGGPDARLGWFYRFGVDLEHQDTTAYWYDFTPSATGSRPQCMAFDGTIARSRGDHQIYLSPNSLDLEVRLEITTTGGDDCSGRAGSGLGLTRFTAEITRDQYAGDEPIVLRTGPDSAVQMEIELTPRGSWRCQPDAC